MAQGPADEDASVPAASAAEPESEAPVEDAAPEEGESADVPAPSEPAEPLDEPSPDEAVPLEADGSAPAAAPASPPPDAMARAEALLERESPLDGPRPFRSEATDEEEASPRTPMRWFGRVGVGAGLRLGAKDDFLQSTFAPVFFSLRGGAVLPVEHALGGGFAYRHGLSLGATANINPDGTFPSGVRAWQQWTFTPAYEARVGRAGVEYVARVGVPITVSPEVSVGAELGVGAQWLPLAGFGFYGELVYDLFVGGQDRSGSTTLHHVLALEVGLHWELERLP